MFWSCVCPDGVHLAKYVLDWVGVPEFSSAATTRGRRTPRIQTYSFVHKLAVYSPVSSDRGFCLSTEGYQKVSLLAAGTSLLSKLLLVSINANGVSLLAECRAKRYSPLPVLSSAAVSSPF